MIKMPFHRYKTYPTLDFSERTWPSKTIRKAPIWCSVDLRDGNQSLIEPMNLSEKLKFYQKLLGIGFQEIEVGFPAASTVEYEFMRHLIEEGEIPEEVNIQVLCQARESLIEKTVDSLKGAKKAIFHLYNSTSKTQRDVVFKKSKEEIMAIAVEGTKFVKEQIQKIADTKITYQYSPESFTQTELDYALEICEAVVDVWQPTENNKIILNLPATVEVNTPNVYADSIEWFLNNLRNRENIVLSLHPHNDRGTATAATELALMAGADRVEGTLFGNGERTGNVDIVTLALNLFSQGIDPELDFSNIDDIRDLTEECNKLPVGKRHPYVGDLVFTAFSGSHQDAISKGMKRMGKQKSDFWDVPYLPIDPEDLGRQYEPIRINSQSGKGGVSYILEKKYNFSIPRKMAIEFSQQIQKISEKTGKEVEADKIYDVFLGYYSHESPLKLEEFQLKHENNEVSCRVIFHYNSKPHKVQGKGNGPVDSFVDCIKKEFLLDFKTTDYQQHTLGIGSAATGVCYYEINFIDGNFYGIGIHSDTIKASFLAVISALNRYFLNTEKKSKLGGSESFLKKVRNFCSKFKKKLI